MHDLKGIVNYNIIYLIDVYNKKRKKLFKNCVVNCII